MYIARSLIKNISVTGEELRFRDFRIFQPDHDQPLPGFEGLEWDEYDSFYERAYPAIPPPHQAVGYGGIPFHFEDTVFLLRLWRTGDITFSPLRILKPDGTLAMQDNSRATADVLSTDWYEIDAAECDDWDAFADRVRASPAWSAPWFQLARRFFLYGTSKEVNVPFDYVDRYIDYAIALEATLAPEQDFSNRRVRERAALLGADGDAGQNAIRSTVRFLYGLRSTLGHGRDLGTEQRDALAQGEQRSIERTVRVVLAAAVTHVPARDAERDSHLKNLWDVSDAVRISKLEEDYRALDRGMQKEVLQRLLSYARKKRILGLALVTVGALLAATFTCAVVM